MITNDSGGFGIESLQQQQFLRNSLNQW